MGAVSVCWLGFLQYITIENRAIRLKCSLLTISHPLGIGDFRKKTPKRTWFCLGISSGPVCSTDSVKVTKDAASLLVCNQKNFCLGGAFFCEWCHKWRSFRSPWPTLPALGQLLGGSISLKFLLETRLQSESFDTLDGLLGFRVQKLWCKLVEIFD